ncbi:DNA primase [Paracoccus sp. p3-h83]|uniref:DNA primase n=1 Tax=Paracoccus sp. p3-h83 TaxID=3342805 RepID=UPI0035B9A7AB
MSLPPGFLDELRNRVPISKIVGRKVAWDRRKTNPAKGDWWAPCPFHHEKTASFHVDDQKGFYYCFGCHAKGDAIGFLKETENLSFIEAVQVLADEAGMQMPAPDPKSREKADRASQLAEVMEAAIRHYRMQLQTAAGSAARDYIASRQLAPETVERFEIGFAPDNRHALFRALRDRGIATDLIEAAGLCATPDDGGEPYDRFRGRIMFPIRDGRGRAIAFGGRAMDPNARAKYLNSPETELFDKGRNLYNLQSARAAVAKGAPLIVAEGYMDVIALVQAGIEGAVAPLGTAVTEDQLRLMWRTAPEPVIALDGDAAGMRAATRLADLAAPMIEAGQALRFATLPAGQDPDDLIKAGGAAAMLAVIDAAVPMIDVLWHAATEGRPIDSPERRAALDKDLRALVARFTDPAIRAHTEAAIRDRRRTLFAPARSPRGDAQSAVRPAFGVPRGRLGGRFGPALPIAPSATARHSALASAPAGVEQRLRESIILATLVVHPALIDRFEAELEDMRPHDPDLAALADALLSAAAVDADARPGHLAVRLVDRAGAALDSLMAQPHVTCAPTVQRREDADLAALVLTQEFARLSADRAIRAEVAEAAADLDGLPDEGLTWRLKQAAAARHRAERLADQDTSDMGEDREALRARLQALIDDQVWRRDR